jgi:uncharacterized protein (TIGR01777 family)
VVPGSSFVARVRHETRPEPQPTDRNRAAACCHCAAGLIPARAVVRFCSVSAKRILITGGTGFIGRRLARTLIERGDAVTVLSRDPAAARTGSGPGSLPAEVRVVAYTPLAEGPWCDELGSADAIVHLAGAQVVGVRWTKGKKREFESSRIDSTRVLVAALSRLAEGSRPGMLVGASAVGYYGSRGVREVDETSTRGDDYLAWLAAEWEAEQARARDLGMRVAHIRFGVVLGEDGGALRWLVLPFKLHMGGRVGEGKQMVPWIHAEDACGIILCAIDNPDANGPINAVAPYQVTMKELTDTIGAVLNRSAYVRVPGALVRALFGEGAAPLLTGQRVASRVPCTLGYNFRFTDLSRALADVLGRV